jgi:hypothetical protein
LLFSYRLSEAEEYTQLEARPFHEKIQAKVDKLKSLTKAVKLEKINEHNFLLNFIG